MTISSINYNNPASGTKIETVSFTRDGATKHFQLYNIGYQPFDITAAHLILNHGASAQDIYPCHKIVVSGQNYWTASGSGTNEYYYTKHDFSSWLNTMQIIQVIANGNDMTQGAVGSLAAGEWAVGDNDSIGTDTIYVRLSDGTDPDTKADAYLCAAFAYPCAGASKAMILPYFSNTSQTAVVRPILYAANLSREDTDVTYFNVPIIMDEISLSSVDIERGDSAYETFGSAFTFDLYGAQHYALAVTTKPSAGTISFYGGVI